MATPENDPYAVLGVPRTADQAMITRAYRKLAITLHPDRTQDDPEAAARFKQVTEAYQKISDPEKRRAFDHGFVPIETVQALRHTAEGRRIAEWLLLRGPSAPRLGVDRIMPLHVPATLLITGGKLVLTLPDGIAITVKERRMTLTVPPDARARAWCRLRLMGEAGTNGGDAGDLWICLVEKKEGI